MQFCQIDNHVLINLQMPFFPYSCAYQVQSAWYLDAEPYHWKYCNAGIYGRAGLYFVGRVTLLRDNIMNQIAQQLKEKNIAKSGNKIMEIRTFVGRSRTNGLHRIATESIYTEK